MEALYTIDKVTGSDDLDVADVSLEVRFDSMDLAALNELVELNSTGSLATLPPEELRALLYQLTSTSPSFEFGPLKTRWQDQELNAGFNMAFNAEGLPDYAAFTPNDLATWLAISAGEAYIDLSEDMALTLAVQYVANEIVAGLRAEGKTADPADIEQVAREQAPQVLYNFTRQGLLKKTEGGYSGRVLLENGQLEINGSAVPLAL